MLAVVFDSRAKLKVLRSTYQLGHVIHFFCHKILLNSCGSKLAKSHAW